MLFFKKRFELLSLLFHDDRQTRDKAKLILNRRHPRWREELRIRLPEIVGTVDAENKLLRESAEIIANVLKDKNVGSATIAIWKYEDEDVHEAAQAILKETAPSWRDDLHSCHKDFIRGLKNGNARFRCISAGLLGLIGDRDAIEPLLALLKDEDESVRETAVRALNLINPHWSKNTIDNLLDDLNNRDDDIANRTAHVLGRIGDAKAIVALYNRKNLYFTTSEKKIRRDMNIDDSTIFGAFKDLISGKSNHAARIATSESHFVKAINRIIRVNKPLLIGYRNLFCRQCNCRARKGYFPLNEYDDDWQCVVFCSSCDSSIHLLTGICKVDGLIGGDIIEPYRKGDTITIPLWIEQERKTVYADIDALIIREGGVKNYHLAVNAVILELTGKKTRRRKKVVIHTEGDPPLSGDVIRMLQDFGRFAK